MNQKESAHDFFSPVKADDSYFAKIAIRRHIRRHAMVYVTYDETMAVSFLR